jgi:hypothetical protein
MPKRYLKALNVGDCFESGPHEVTKEAIIACGREFDPEPAIKAPIAI